MSQNRSARIVVLAIIWLMILAGLAVAYKLLVKPSIDKKTIEQTSSKGNYRHTVNVSLDSFSGYAFLRSEAYRKRLQSLGVRLTIEDDGADYTARLDALKRGDSQMGVFTIDSYLAAGARAKDFPGSIVLLIDETKGADAIVSYAQGLPSLQELNRSEARIVLTPDSPSEFLARIAVAHFNLPQLPPNWKTDADGSADVYKRFAGANPALPTAYVMWEPDVARALEKPGAQLLIDSSKLRGYILDVLVVERDFLRKNHDLVKDMVKAYLQTVYEAEGNQKLTDLIKKDAGGELSAAQAEQLVKGIEWKNTTENYAHFGLLPPERSKNVPLLDDSIIRISQVLVQTGALDEDPVEGQPNRLYYDRIFRELQNEGFHPSRPISIIANANNPGLVDTSELRGYDVLPSLSKDQWHSLEPVAEMRIPNLSFGRGTARLNTSSKRALTDLAKQLESFPNFYVRVIGTTRAEGDTEANKKLATERANSAMDFLISAGLHKNRVHADPGEAQAKGGSAQSVSFVVGDVAY